MHTLSNRRSLAVVLIMAVAAVSWLQCTGFGQAAPASDGTSSADTWVLLARLASSDGEERMAAEKAIVDRGPGLVNELRMHPAAAAIVAMHDRLVGPPAAELTAAEANREFAQAVDYFVAMEAADYLGLGLLENQGGQTDVHRLSRNLYAASMLQEVSTSDLQAHRDFLVPRIYRRYQSLHWLSGFSSAQIAGRLEVELAVLLARLLNVDVAATGPPAMRMLAEGDADRVSTAVEAWMAQHPEAAVPEEAAVTE